MKDKNTIKYYCFTKKCGSSIFSENCVTTVLPLGEDLSTEYCLECGKELISKEELNIKIQLSQILHEGKHLTSFVIDDDPVYHILVKKLFEHSTTFDKLNHYMDGTGALNYLTENRDDADALPDIIFVDVNMPNMDAWEFLNEFAIIYPLLSKKLSIYVMTSFVNPKYYDHAKTHPYVKGIIAKDFDLSFLNNIAI